MSCTLDVNYTLDKTGWPPGEWDKEPDFEEFIHNGLRCIVRRVGHGGLCGYVIIPNNHHNYMIDSYCLEAHGGITFDERVSLLELEEIESLGFTDVEGTRIIGFDCAHYSDLLPISLRESGPLYIDLSGYGGTYRNFEYVKDEVISLCDQIK